MVIGYNAVLDCVASFSIDINSIISSIIIPVNCVSLAVKNLIVELRRVVDAGSIVVDYVCCELDNRTLSIIEFVIAVRAIRTCADDLRTSITTSCCSIIIPPRCCAACVVIIRRGVIVCICVVHIHWIEADVVCCKCIIVCI